MRQSARMSLRGSAVAAAIAFVVTVFASPAWSRAAKPVKCHEMTEALAKALFDEWNKALQQTPDKVVQTYTTDAILLPTFENGPLIGHKDIRTYFVHFLEKHPFGRVDTRAIIPAGCNMGVVAGLYTFTVDEGTTRVDSPARYTYVYTYNEKAGRWLIAHHHSSARPQKSAAK